MESPTALTPAQLVLVWTLLSVLLAWMVIFAILALRIPRTEEPDLPDWQYSTGPFPALPAVVHTPRPASPSRPPLPVESPLGAHIE